MTRTAAEWVEYDRAVLPLKTENGVIRCFFIGSVLAVRSSRMSILVTQSYTPDNLTLAMATKSLLVCTGL